MEVPEMAKTSMFGGHMVAETPAATVNQMTSYLHSNTGVASNAIEADSCMTINGSSVNNSPSPTNKA